MSGPPRCADRDTASRTVSDLLRRGRIAEASQYHILDGNTHATPVEHGRILLDLLSGRQPSSTRTERRSIDGVQRAVPYRSPTVTINIPTPVPNAALPRNAPATEASPRIRCAPPPNASATEVARVAARNMLTATNAASAQGPIAQPQVESSPPTIPQPTMTTATPSQPARTLAPIQALRITGRSAHRTRFDELMCRLMTGANQGLPLAGCSRAAVYLNAECISSSIRQRRMNKVNGVFAALARTQSALDRSRPCERVYARTSARAAAAGSTAAPSSAPTSATPFYDATNARLLPGVLARLRCLRCA